jgi:hypothetical protein
VAPDARDGAHRWFAFAFELPASTVILVVHA